MKSKGTIRDESSLFKIIHKGKTYEYLRSNIINPERKTLLIFHGIATTAELMENEIRHFEKEFNVIAPTLNHVNSFSEWSEVIHRIFVIEGVKRVIVKGGSFGGILAQGYYRNNAEIVDGLILVNTLPPQGRQAKSDRKILMLLKLFPLVIFKKLMLKKLDILLSIVGLSLDEIEKVQTIKLKMAEILSKKIKKSHLKAIFKILHEFDSDPKYLNTQNGGKPNILFITSNTDPSYARLENIKKMYPGINIKEFGDVGHLLPILRQDAYLKLICNFVNEV